MSKKTYFLDKKENIQRILYVFYALCVGLVLMEFLIHRHVKHPFEGAFGFYALFGFVACVALVLAATQMRKVLMRGPDYYDAPEEPVKKKATQTGGKK